MTLGRFPALRPRRLRKSSALRAMVRETAVAANDLIQPIFVEEAIDAPQPVGSMPGVMRIPECQLEPEIERLARGGVKAVLLFGVSHRKDATGSDA